ncbi:MAG: NAD-dependent epimerase/dehydratase family protein [Candidatus Kapaibacteriota bacterium]|jgi:nucleoside-diphosphate-sugar epimerase
MKNILITGALGQIGSDLSNYISNKFPNSNITISDIRTNEDVINSNLNKNGFDYHQVNVLDNDKIDNIINQSKPDIIFHLAALLSATGEKDPMLCWNINMQGTINILNNSLKHKVEKVFIPSSIAVWGKGIETVNTPQESVLKPTTMYGVTKVAGELLADYYVQKYGLDCRGLRYPGIISSETAPGGGTTDYAVEIYYEAIKHKKYNCFLRADTALPMMYMPDCLKATVDLMTADFKNLVHHSDFNLGAMSFTPNDLYLEIKKHIPEFEITYNPDYRQAIADSWPQSIDDSAARNEWNWSPDYNLETMTKDMIEKLSERL